MEQINENVFQEKFYVREMPIQIFQNLINDSDNVIIYNSDIKIIKIRKIGEYIYLRIKTKHDKDFANCYFNSVYNATSFHYVNLYHKLLLMGFKPKQFKK